MSDVSFEKKHSQKKEEEIVIVEECPKYSSMCDMVDGCVWSRGLVEHHLISYNSFVSEDLAIIMEKSKPARSMST